MSTDRQAAGKDAELRAETLLARHGLTPVTRNYRCRVGEIDLIMRDGPYLVFIEVRLRRHCRFGGPLMSIDPHKQRRLVRTAEHYLQHTRWQGPCRFDVVGFDGDDSQGEWIKDAFGAQG